MSLRIGNALAQFFKAVQKPSNAPQAVPAVETSLIPTQDEAQRDVLAQDQDKSLLAEEQLIEPVQSTSASSQLIFIFQYIRGQRNGYMPKLGRRAYSSSIKVQKKGGRASKGALINVTDEDAA